MIDKKEQLKLQLNQAILQLQQAEKALNKQETAHASIYVGNAKGILMKLGAL